MAEPDGRTGDALARFRADLEAVYRQADDELRGAFDRSLSPDDTLVDRWERARRLGFADGASIYGSAAVYGDVRVGEQTWIGPGCLLDGSGAPLAIGAWCAISAGVHVYTHDTVHRSLSLGVAPTAAAPVTIGDGCHLGAQSIVRPGVTIGDRCVVGANSYVSRSVPDRTVVVGSPARPVGIVRGDGHDVEIDTGPAALEELAQRQADSS